MERTLVEQTSANYGFDLILEKEYEEVSMCHP